MKQIVFLVVLFAAAANCQWYKVNNGGQPRYTTESDAMPSTRRDAAMWCHGDDIYIYSGESKFDAPNDMWKYETENDRWLWQPTPPTKLGSRYGAATWALNGLMWLYGGFNASGATLGDLWAFQPDTREWKEIDATMCPPLAGVAHWTHPQSDRMFMYANNAMYAIDTKTEKCAPVLFTGMGPTTAVAIVGFEQDVAYVVDENINLFTFDIVKNKWATLNKTQFNGRRPRVGENLWLSPEQDELMLFGGKDGGEILGDFWSYDVKAKKWTRQPDSGPNQRWGASQCTGKDGSTYMFGGEMDGPTEKYNDLWKYGPLNKQNLISMLHFKFDSVSLAAYGAFTVSIMILLLHIMWILYNCAVRYREKKESARRKRDLRMIVENPTGAFSIDEENDDI